MATIIIIAIILICIAVQVLWGSLIRSFAVLVSAMLAMFIAFGFFERMAGLFINSNIIPWKAHGAAMALLFVLTFGILVALCMKLLGEEIGMSPIVDKVGGAIIGLPTGLIVAGTVIVALSLASGSSGFPYERFSSGQPQMDNPKKSFLSADGFATGLFGLVSSGSFAGDNSFVLVRAGFNNSAGIDRIGASKGISPLAGNGSINGTVVVRKAPPTITDADGKKLEETTGSELYLARVKMTKSVVGKKDKPDFLLGQLSLICTRKDDKAIPGTGTGICVYPVGYLKTPARLKKDSPLAVVPLADAEMEDGIKAIDFAFYIPTHLRPEMVSFKRNFVTDVALVNIEEAPSPVGFDKSSTTAATVRDRGSSSADPNS